MRSEQEINRRLGEIESNENTHVDGSVEHVALRAERTALQWVLGVDPAVMDWDHAKAHFDAVRRIYQDLEGKPGVNTSMALRAVFDPLSKRFNCGERTRELYDAMMEVE